jgi:hypothetical protein
MASRRNGRRKARHFLSAKLGGCKEETPNEKSAALKYRERDDEKASQKEGFENGEIAQGRGKVLRNTAGAGHYPADLREK